MKRLIAFSTLIIFIYGCPGRSDFCTKLCGDYYILRTSAQHIQVSPMSFDDNTPMIPIKVVELGHNQKFIIAKQKHINQGSFNNRKGTYKKPNPGVLDYWILDVTIPKVYGPFSSKEFYKKRTELKVPRGLKMKDVYKYKK
jgi:hypothetical protein